MRVLLDLSVLSAPTLSRGIGRYVSSLACELHRRAIASRGSGDELSVFAIPDRPLLRAPRVTEDIPAILEELFVRRKQGMGSYVLPKGGRRALVRAIGLSRADVVHSLDPQAMPLRDLPCRRVVTCHHLDSNASAAEWHGARAEVARSDRQRYHLADRVIAISRATAQELIARLDLPRGRISVVHNGVSLEDWSGGHVYEGAARLAALGLQKRPYLLCVGALHERKNVDGVLQGLKRARAIMGREDLVVVWAGLLDRTERQRLRAKTRRLGVSEAVIQVGYVSDANLAALYEGATALVFASKREGFGFPIVEAMAGGCPVITSNCSSLIEVAEGAALTVDPDDSNAIADAIVLLADDNAERRRLAGAGKIRAGDFSIKRLGDGTLDAYKRACVGSSVAS